MKDILVTGGAGFIGSHLCEALIQAGMYKVTSLDNYSTGSSKNHINGVRYVCGEVEDICTLIDFAPNIVFHLGEYARVEQSFEDIDIVYRSNKIGIFEVLEFCRKNGSKIIYAGSSTKFGDGGLGRNQSPYAWTKATNTELVINYAKWFNIQYAITYFYNVYGPREIGTGKYATLIGIFKEKMLKGQKLSIVSPGTQRRNFTHVSDIVSGIMLVGEAGFGDDFGIGSQTSYSILEVATMFGGVIEMVPERAGNRMSAELLIKKICELGWQEQHALSEYIDSMRINNWLSE